MTEFELLVKEMRDTQKEYFRTRDKEVLKKSKALEKRVDEHFCTYSNMDILEAIINKAGQQSSLNL